MKWKKRVNQSLAIALTFALAFTMNVPVAALAVETDPVQEAQDVVDPAPEPTAAQQFNSLVAALPEAAAVTAEDADAVAAAQAAYDALPEADKALVAESLAKLEAVVAALAALSAPAPLAEGSPDAGTDPGTTPSTGTDGAAWGGDVAEAFAGGTGTADDPYQIADAAQLAYLAKKVNEGESYSGQHFKLTADINLNNQAWTPIGTETHPFSGAFDGAGKTISNLAINNAELEHAGLFGYISSPASVKNITLQNASVTAKSRVGALFGSAYTGSVENCHVTGSIQVQGHWMVGGLTGYGYAIINGCSVAGSEGSFVKGSWTNGVNLEGDNIGGLVGFTGEGTPYDRISNCTVSGLAVSGTRKVGGMLGYLHYGVHVSNCSVSGVTVTCDLTGNPNYLDGNNDSSGIGGLVGVVHGTDPKAPTAGPGAMTDCTVSNVTLVTGDTSSMAGYFYGKLRNTSEQPAMTNCFASNCTGSTVAKDTTAYNGSDGNQAVASVNGTSYATLDAAIAAADVGGTVTLLANATVDATLEITAEKDITLDLNNYVLTSSVAIPTVRVEGKLAVKDSSASGQGMIENTVSKNNYQGYVAVKVAGGENLSPQFDISSGKISGTVRIEGNSSPDTGRVSYPAKISVSENAVISVSGNDRGPAVALFGAGAQLDMKGGQIISNSLFAAVQGNGTVNDKRNDGDTLINISGGEVKGPYAVYHPQSGTLNVTGGTLEGVYTGIEMRAGTLNISGDATIKGLAKFDSWYHASGATVDGAGVAISQHTTELPIKVNIAGGTISGNKALYEGIKQNPDDPNKIINPHVTLAVTGGTFNAIEVNGSVGVAVESQNYSGFITGGTFSTDVTGYLGTGRIVKQNEQGMFVVEKDQVATVTKPNGDSVTYDNLNTAVNRAKNGDTVTLLKNVPAGNAKFEIDDSIVLDLNGYSIDSTKYATVFVNKYQGPIDVTIINGTILNSTDGKGEHPFGTAIQVRQDVNLTLENVNVDTSSVASGVPSYGVRVGLGTTDSRNPHVTVKGASTHIKGVDAGIAVIGSNKAARSGLVVEAGVIEGGSFGIAGNGTNDGTSIEIKGGTVRSTSEDGCAIYHPQDGDLTISGGMLEGANGVQFCGAGKLSIEGGSIEAKAAVVETLDTSATSASILDGAALSLVSRGGEYGAAGSAEVSITGGTLTSTRNDAIQEYAVGDVGSLVKWLAIGQDEKKTPNVSGAAGKSAVSLSALTGDAAKVIVGGTFSSDPSVYVPVGYGVENTQTGFVVENAPVAKIGETIYTSLQGAFDAAQNGETIVLTSNVVVLGVKNAVRYTGGKSFTVDFDAHQVIGNTTNAVFLIVGSNESESVVTFKNGVVTAGPDGFSTFLAGALSGGKGATVNIDGMTLNNSKQYGNSIKAASKAVINVSNTTVNSTNGAGGTEAAGGEVNIVDCTYNQGGFYDHNSVNVAASNGGVATVKGGTYKAASYGLYVFNSGGTINVEGGTFESGKAVLKADDSTKSTPSAINVLGGKFSGEINIGAKSSLSISGGTFSSDPTTYVDAAHALVANNGDGTWTVGTKAASITKDGAATYYISLDAALKAAQTGDTVVFLRDCAEDVTLPADKNLTLNGNGYAISGKLSGTNVGDVEIKNTTFTTAPDVSLVTGKRITFSSCTFDKANGTEKKNPSVTVRNGSAAFKNCSFVGTDGGDQTVGIQTWGAAAAEVSGCTFVGFSGTPITLSNTTGNVYVTNNVIEGWGTAAGAGGLFPGRAMRLDLNSAPAGTKVVVTGNKMVKGDFDSAKNESFVKLSGANLVVADITVTNNYWNGLDPTTAEAIADGESGDSSAVSIMQFANGGLTLYPYFTDAAMTTLATAESQTKTEKEVVDEKLSNAKTPEAAKDAAETLASASQATKDALAQDEAAKKQIAAAETTLTGDANSKVAPTAVDDKADLETKVEGAALTAAAVGSTETVKAKVTIEETTLPADKVLPGNAEGAISLDVSMAVVKEDGTVVASDVQPVAPITLKVKIPDSITDTSKLVIYHFHGTAAEPEVFSVDRGNLVISEENGSRFATLTLSKLSYLVFARSGDVYDVSQYRTGESATWTYPEAPVGQVFAGWYTDSALTTPLGKDVATGQAYAKFVNVSDIITFKGGSLRMDTDANVSTNLRFGYSIKMPNGLTFIDAGWTASGTNAKGEPWTKEIKAVNKIVSDTGIIETNLVLINLLPAQYSQTWYSTMNVSYATADGTTVSAAEFETQERSVRQIAEFIKGSNTATAVEKEYAQAVLDAISVS